MKKILFLTLLCLTLTNCGCPKTCKQVEIQEKNRFGFTNLSTVPDFPTDYPTKADWAEIRKDLKR